MIDGYDIAQAEFSISNRSMFTKAERAQHRKIEATLIREVNKGAPITDLANFFIDKKELMLARVQRRYERLEYAKGVDND